MTMARIAYHCFLVLCLLVALSHATLHAEPGTRPGETQARQADVTSLNNLAGSYVYYWHN